MQLNYNFLNIYIFDHKLYKKLQSVLQIFTPIAGIL